MYGFDAWSNPISNSCTKKKERFWIVTSLYSEFYPYLLYYNISRTMEGMQASVNKSWNALTRCIRGWKKCWHLQVLVCKTRMDIYTGPRLICEERKHQAVLWVLICTVHLAVFSYHVYASLAKWIVFVYELNGCGFESRCSYLNFRYRACFEQGVPWHSGNYRVRSHSETCTWHGKNKQTKQGC